MGVEQYRELFVTESEEHLQLINESLLELEKNSNNPETMNKIFRSVHTLKGMSATMGFESLTKLAHRMEDVFDIFRKQKTQINTEVIDVLFKCLDTLEMLLEEVKGQKEMNIDVDQMIVQLESILPSLSEKTQEGKEEKKPVYLSRIEKDNLEKIVKEQDLKIYVIDINLARDCQLKSARVFIVFHKLAEFGEVVKSQPCVEDLEVNRFGYSFSLIFLSKIQKKKIEDALTKIMEIDKVDLKILKNLSDIAQEPEPAPTIQVTTAAAATKQEETQGKELMQLGFKKIQSIRVNTQRLDKLMNLVGELVIAKIRLMQISQTHHIQQLDEILTNIDRLTGELQDEVMQARLIPMAQVFDRFPRMVRDLAHSKGKQINLEITGGEIELDRTVLDEIADPLVHLLRNSVDHGVELPQERKNHGKSPVGLIKLSARRERTHVLIEVGDDGRGIDPDLMRETAIKKGFLTEEEAGKLSDKEILNIITLPGFSTASQVTDTSGRGVGMDVVKMKIESLGGSLNFDSKLGQSSNFSLKLPLTVAIIRAMLVKVNEEIYATPIANIAETVKVNENKIKRIEKLEVINLRNEVLPLIRLGKVLGSTNGGLRESSNKEISIVIVEVSGKKAGLIVDQLLGQQEVVIKSMGSILKGIKGFAGATILGDGRVALILDVATLMG